MTQSTRSSRAEAKRREQEWITSFRQQEALLQALPNRDLDALVATVVFNDSGLAGMPFSTSWDGLGRILEHMRECGYTMRCYVFERSHLDWMNNLPGRTERGDTYQAAEVSVVDIHHRLALPLGWPHLEVRANTLPHAATIAAVLTRQMEKEQPVSQPKPVASMSGWTEERRRRHSEQMKAYWQRKNAAGHGKQEADQDDDATRN